MKAQKMAEILSKMQNLGILSIAIKVRKGLKYKDFLISTGRNKIQGASGYSQNAQK